MISSSAGFYSAYKGALDAAMSKPAFWVTPVVVADKELNDQLDSWRYEQGRGKGPAWRNVHGNWVSDRSHCHVVSAPRGCECGEKRRNVSYWSCGALFGRDSCRHRSHAAALACATRRNSK